MAVAADLDIVCSAGGPVHAKLRQMHQFLSAFRADSVRGVIKEGRPAANGAALKFIAVTFRNHFFGEYKGGAVIQVLVFTEIVLAVLVVQDSAFAVFRIFAEYSA